MLYRLRTDQEPFCDFRIGATPNKSLQDFHFTFGNPKPLLSPLSR